MAAVALLRQQPAAGRPRGVGDNVRDAQIIAPRNGAPDPEPRAGGTGVLGRPDQLEIALQPERDVADSFAVAGEAAGQLLLGVLHQSAHELPRAVRESGDECRERRRKVGGVRVADELEERHR